MNLDFFNKNKRRIFVPKHLSDALGPGVLITPLEAFGLDYDYLKSLNKKYHPDTGEPIVSEKTLEVSTQLTINPVMTKVERPGFGLMGLSLQHNLRTTAGANWQQNAMAGFTNTGYTSTLATTAGATAQSIVDSANTTWAAGQWEKHIVVVDSGTAFGTGKIVYGTITGNTATTASAGTIYVDKWIDPSSGALAAGTTPSATAGAKFSILPTTAPAFWVALTTTNITPAAGDTTLSGEANASGVARAFVGAINNAGAAGFTSNTSTQYQFVYKWTFTGSSQTTYYAGGMFTGAVAGGAVDSNAGVAGGGILFLETLLSSTATVSASGDTIQITWQVNT